MAQVCLVAAFVALDLRPLGDPDLGWHLRTGEYVVHHGFTSTDPWSFASSRPWVLHEWGGEVLMYLAYRADGYHGIIAFRVVFAGLLGWLVVRSCRRYAGPGISLFVSLLAFLSLWARSTERPQLISFCLLAACVPLLLDWVERGRAPWWLPPVIAVWANVHALWFAALLLYGAMVAGRVLEVGIASWRRWWQLVAIGACSGLAAALNPAGLRLLAIFQVSSGSFIGEFSTPSPFEITNIGTAVLACVIFVTWARSSNRARPTEVVFVLAALGLGLMYERNVPIAAIALAPVAARCLYTRSREHETVPPKTPTRDRIAAVALVAVLLLAAAIKLPSVQPLVDGTPKTAPVALDALPGRAQVLNEYGLGGWILWTARDSSPGIDGRSEVYDPGYLTSYLASLRMDPGWRQFVADQRFDAAWLYRTTPLVNGLRSIGWRPIAHEGSTVILVPPTG
jgi:hypothetical protein